MEEKPLSQTTARKKEILSRTWLLRGDLPADGLSGKGRKEEGNRTKRMEDRERTGKYILSILYREKLLSISWITKNSMYLYYD